MTQQRDHTAENILEHLSNLENNPDETISTYREFNVGASFTTSLPVGFSIVETLVHKR